MNDNKEDVYVKVENIETGEIVKCLGPTSHRKAIKAESGLADRCSDNYNSFITWEGEE